MLTSGDVLELDLGIPSGPEAALRHPAVVVTAQTILDASPSVIHVVPLTTTMRGFGSEVHIEPNESSGIDHPSAAQCQHIRAVSTARVDSAVGKVGADTLAEIREVVGVILDLPR